MIQPDYANPSAYAILNMCPHANWRKCDDCGSESLHIDSVQPESIKCQHCKSKNTHFMKEATEKLEKQAHS